MMTQEQSEPLFCGCNRGRVWTAKEIALLTEHFKKFPNGPIPKIPGRSIAASRNKACVLGLHKINLRRAWKTSEIQTLVTVFPDKGPAGCVDLLPGRTVSAIEAMACRLGVKMPYPKSNAQQVDEMLRREVDAVTHKVVDQIALKTSTRTAFVRWRAKTLGLFQYSNRPVPWTDAEDEILIRYSHDQYQCFLKLQDAGFHRTPDGINVRCKKLKLSGTHSDGLTTEDVSRCFGVAPETVARWSATKLLPTPRLQSFRDARAWDITEVRKFMVENPRLWEVGKISKSFLLEILTTG